jgi:predicted unusual protein kinase regulating ubiquinone biosynthesis (AarF/ABC1/UbiB family)
VRIVVPYLSGRTARITRLVARLAVSRGAAFTRRLFARGDARARYGAERRKAEADRITEELGQMKGLVMKAGQLMSFIVGENIPAEYRTALSSLQADAPHVPFPLIRAVVEEELGRDLERSFARFEMVPFAAASIGQVHRARLPTGEDVAVKVQYPGVADAIRSDIDQARTVYAMAWRSNPVVDMKAFMSEIAARFTEELDYVHEARCQEGFRARYDGHPFIRIPRVFDSHSTARILTTEYIEGRRFHDVRALDAKARSRYGEILFRFFFGSCGRFGAFNGDPHPGNYRFDDEGRVAFFDFGCVKFVGEPLLEHWRRMDQAHLDGDRTVFFEELVALNYCSPGVASPDDWYRMFAPLYAPMRDDAAYTFTPEDFAERAKRAFRPEAPLADLVNHVNRPADFAFAQRVQLGVQALLSELGAKANWRRIYREIMLHGEPHGDLGELERSFWEKRGPDFRAFEHLAAPGLGQ